MALPSGNFSNALSGRLQVLFSGEFSATSGSDWGNGVNSLILRCLVGAAGPGQQKAYIQLGGASTAILERDYVGGSGNVPVAIEYVSHSFDGPGVVEAKNLRIACRLYRS